MAMEYFSFEKVLKELQMEEDELKRLVSEGEIRAFRDEEKMKFKASDIAGLKKGRMTEPTIILPSGGDDEGTEEESEVLLVEDDTSETLLDIDDLDDGSGMSSEAIPTVDFSESSHHDTSSETLTEELVFDDDSSSSVIALEDSSSAVTEDIGAAATFVDDSSGMLTEPLDLVDDSSEILQAASGAQTIPSRPATRGRTAAARPVSARVMPVATAPQGDPVMATFLILTAIVMLVGGFLAINLIVERDGQTSAPITDFLTGLRPPDFADDDTNKQFSDSEIMNHKSWRKKYREGDPPKIDALVQEELDNAGEDEGDPME